MIGVRAMLFCDDVRYELGNKITAVGMYGDFIGFPPGQGNIILPKFAAIFIVKGLRNHARVGLRQQIQVVRPGEGLKEIAGPVQTMVRDPANDEQNVIFQMSPLVFPGDCSISAAIELTVEGEAPVIFRNSLQVKRLANLAAPIPAPVMPPGADMN